MDIETDSFFLWEFKLTSFLFADRNYLVLMFGLELTRFLCAGRKCLFLVWGSIDLVLCGWSKLTWFAYAGRKSLRFSVSIEIDVVLGVRNWLIFNMGDGA